MGSLWWKILLYFTVFVFALFMTLSGFSKLLTLVIIFAATFLSFFIFFYYPLLLEKRIDRLDSYLRKRKKSPGIYIHYVLANRLDDEAKLIIEQLMNKYTKPETQAVYKTAYGVYRNDMGAVREVVPYIQNPNFRTYYETAILIENGESDRARAVLKTIKKDWMRLALLAGIEIKAGHNEATILYAREALNSSRGINRYALYKEYERILPQAVENIS